MKKLLATAAIAASFFAFGAQPSFAQSAPASTVPATDEEIVVRGTPPAEVVRSFVSQMAITSRSTNQLARWDRKICPGIGGLRTRYAQFLLDRMAQRAIDVGLDVDEPGCKANILILVSPDPDAIARELATRHMSAMGLLNERGRSSLGRTHVRRFVESDAPVRWWHVNRTHTRDGVAIGSQTDGSAPVVFLSGNSTRLGRTTREDFGAAFIIVDARTLQGINYNWEGLADYLAMVALAQLDPRADTAGFSTILNMFAQGGRGTAPRALTDWDMAYLRGLYTDATRDARSANQQEGEIARSISRELSAPPRN